MFESIVDLLAHKLHAELCLLYILDEETSLLELWGAYPRNEDASSAISQRVSGPFLFTWLEENYESLTRTKEGLFVM
jgi:hypothetical protein